MESCWLQTPTTHRLWGPINSTLRRRKRLNSYPNLRDTAFCVWCLRFEKEYESGIIKADMTINSEEAMTTVLFVVELGPDCYKDEKRFPNGPWCQKGDFVLVRPYSGSRLVIHGREFRIINDDSVEGVVEDPRGIKRK